MLTMMAENGDGHIDDDDDANDRSPLMCSHAAAETAVVAQLFRLTNYLMIRNKLCGRCCTIEQSQNSEN